MFLLGKTDIFKVERPYKLEVLILDTQGYNTAHILNLK